MGLSEKRKGTRVEQEIRALHEECGVRCRRVPLSGSAPGDTCDLEVMGGRSGGGWDVEVKYRKGARGWSTILGWLGESEQLLVDYPSESGGELDRRLVVLSWPRYLALLLGGQTLREACGEVDHAHVRVSTSYKLGTVLGWLDGVDYVLLRHHGVRQPIAVMRLGTYQAIARRWRALQAQRPPEEQLPPACPEQAQLDVEDAIGS